MNKQLILAGSYDEYRRMLASHLPESKYIGRLPEGIRGLSDTSIYLLGTYYMRKDFTKHWDEVAVYCKVHNISILYQEDFFGFENSCSGDRE